MITKKSWDEFRSTGLLLIINQLLHVFGWAIVFDFNEDGKLKEVYPARCKFRGFDNESVFKSYRNVTNYLRQNLDDLIGETKE